MRGDILVTGATGTVGIEVVRALLARGLRPRAAVRTPRAAERMRGLGAIPVLFDYYRLAPLRQAMQGVDRLFLLTPEMEDPGDLVENTLEVAVQCGVTHVTRMTADGVDPNSDCAHSRNLAATETLVVVSGLQWTILRPSIYASNVLRFQSEAIRQRGTFFGARGTSQVNYVSPVDVGAVAAKILADPLPHNHRTYRLTGPQAVAQQDVAKILTRLVGRPVTYRALTTEAVAEALERSGTPRAIVQHWLQSAAARRMYRNAQASNDVYTLLGRPAESMESYLSRHPALLSAAMG